MAIDAHRAGLRLVEVELEPALEPGRVAATFAASSTAPVSSLTSLRVARRAGGR